MPHTVLRLPGTSGFIRNNNNKQRVALYFPAVFHPESSKHFTDRDSPVLSPGCRHAVGVGVEQADRELWFSRMALQWGWGTAVNHLVWGSQVASRSGIEVKSDRGLQAANRGNILP